MAIKNKTMHNITGYSKIVTLGIVLLLTTTLIFPIHLFDFGNHINPVLAFSNKYSHSQRFDSGYQQGLKICDDQAEVKLYKQTDEYKAHSQDYKNGFFSGSHNCDAADANGSNGPVNNGNNPNNTDMNPKLHNNNNNSPALATNPPDNSQQTPDNSQQTPDNSQQTPQNDINSTSGSNGQKLDFGPICNTLQIAFYHSCSELVNPDGSLTSLGSDTVKCTLSGAAIGGIASFVLPTGIVIEGLSALAGPTGCGGLVKIDQLSSIGNIHGILNILTKFIP